VVNVIKNNTAPVSKNVKTLRPSILFIDEVDVFFEKQFFGELYLPVALLKEKEFQDIVQYIWACKDSSLSLNKV